MALILLVLSVVTSAEEMQRHVWLVTHDPAIVTRSDVKEIACFHFNDAAVVHGRRRATGDDQPDVFYGTAFESLRRSNVDRPFPAGFVAGAADSHPSEANEFELAFFENANFIRAFKALENDFVHDCSSR